MKPAFVSSPPDFDAVDDLPPAPRQRSFAGRAFVLAAGAALLLAAAVALLPADLPDAQRWLLVLTFGALAVLAAVASRKGPRRGEELLALVVAAAITAGTLGLELLGVDLGGAEAGLLGLLGCVACAVAGLRMGLLCSALAALAVLALAGASGFGQRTLVALFAIAAGLAAGWLIARVVARHVRAAEERERRFRGLLAIAADGYWEIDERYRLVAYRQQGVDAADAAEAATPPATGRVPWELPEFDADGDTLDLLRTHLEAREPFRDLPVRWSPAPGRVRHLLASGEPRQGAGGVFLGYWGVLRDVSADVQARLALATTETRYQDLFTHIPTPLVLHAAGQVLDANPAALAMFGFADAASMVGADLLSFFEAGDPRERARRRIDELMRLPPGEALPVAEFRLAERGGRRAVVRATGVHVDSLDGTTVLSIFVDDTERKRAEDAVRRSEAMLSHLVATSPDLIALTDLASGRYAMINRAFEQLTGYAEAEVVGRRAVELGVWRDPAAREAFVARVRERGRVHDQPADFVTKGGAMVPVRVSGARFAMDRRDYLVINARDVTEARQAEQALARARDAAEAASRAKSAFLANTSHELRTPLNGLLGLARLAADPAMPDTRRLQCVAQIGESAQSLAAIISDILDLSKIEAGKLELDHAAFDLGALLRELQRSFAAAAEPRGLALPLQVGEGVDARVVGDRLRTRQIVANYLGNALKFTERGEVRLVARRLDPAQVRFEVHDTGPGIDAAAQARLFNPFTQADDSTTRRYGGTGLGLSICRELAQLMGGRVGLVSQAGQGSCFWAELPLPPAQGVDADATAQAGDDALPPGARVLMVEDNPVNMLVAVALLEQWQLQVEQAADGEQAVAAARRAAAAGRPFDLVLMDVMMPGMSGHQAARILRREFDARTLPIVALTAAALVSEREQALAAGMNDFLTKPIDADRLRAALARWLRRDALQSPRSPA